MIGIQQQERVVMSQEAAETSAQTLTPTASMAQVSFVFGILAICFTPPLVSGLVALITGLIARNQIRRANGQLGGTRMALAGIVLGGVSLGLLLLALTAYALLWVVAIATASV